MDSRERLPRDKSIVLLDRKGIRPRRIASSAVDHLVLRLMVVFVAFLTVASTDPTYSCPPGWYVHESKCYYIETTQRTYSSCSSLCTSYNSMMTCIENSAEKAFIAANPISTTHLWLSLNDMTNEGTYVWSAGCPSSYLPWTGSNPDNFGGGDGEDCGILVLPQSGFADVFCTNTFDCGCETAHVLSAPACPAGWIVGLYGECYFIETAVTTHDSCITSCAARGADMICVQNDEQNDFLWAHHRGRSLWLGYQQQTTGFSWPAGCSSGYTNWQTNEPNNGNGPMYVIQHAAYNSKWTDTTYDEPSVNCGCQLGSGIPPTRQPTPMPTAAPTAPTPAPTALPSIVPLSSCPAGWFQYTDRCYFMDSAQRDFTTCQALCTGKGASMACVQNSEQDRFITTNFPFSDTQQGTGVFIGYTDTNAEGAFSWLNGCSSSYTNWLDGEPNNVGDAEDCVISNRYEAAWADISCDLPYSCACETPLAVSTPICPVGWLVSSTGGCLYLENTASTWDQCHSTCAAQNAIMLCVEDQAQQDFIWTYRAGRNTWLGYSQVGGSWAWNAGCSSGYAYWNSGVPIASGTSDKSFIFEDNGGWIGAPGAAANVYCACQTAPVYKTWNSDIAAASNAVLLSAGAYRSLGLNVSATTATPRDKVLITVNLNCRSISTTISLGLTIFRNGVDLFPTLIRQLSGVVSGRVTAGSFTYLDSPNAIGDFEYVVKAKGSGLISYNETVRQMAAVTIPSYYPVAEASSATTLAISDTEQYTTLSLDATITTTRADDRVLVLLHTDLELNAVAGAYVTIFRGVTDLGGTSVMAQIHSTTAGMLRFAGNVFHLDAPGSVGTFTYSARVKAEVTTVTLTRTRQLALIVLPKNQAKAIQASNMLFLSSESWMSLQLQLIVGPVAADDTVLVTLTVPCRTNDGTPPSAFTIFRGGMNLGDAESGLQINLVPSGGGGNDIINVVITFVDRPAFTGSVTYTAMGRTLGTGNVQIPSAVHRQLTAELISEAFGMPSSMPSSHPSSQPSRQPSTQPTVYPTGQPTTEPTNSQDISCPVGWVASADKCYLLPDFQAYLYTFDNCHSHCHNLSATMLCLEDSDERMFVKNNLADSLSDVWLGLNEIAVDGSFTWDTGCHSNYTWWAANEPSVVTQDQCAAMTLGTGTWVNTQCIIGKICPCELPRVAAPSTCPAGWLTASNGDCFRFDLVDVSSPQACEDSCHADGADLVCLRELSDAIFLRDHMGSSSVWIGYKRTVGTWGWRSDCESTFVHWGSGWPLNASPESYASLEADLTFTERSASEVTPKCACQKRAAWRQMYAVADSESSSVVLRPSTHFNLGLDVIASTTSELDTVLLTVTLNHRITDSGLTGEYTIYRDDINLAGGDDSFLQIVTDGVTPTAMLTAPPSRSPTPAPTSLPSAEPTPTGTDCTVYCAVAELAIIQVAVGLSTGMYRLSPNFKLNFQIYGTILAASAATRNNIFELSDVSNGANLLSLSMTETLAVQIKYNGVVVAEDAAILPSNYLSAWTLITITVEQNQLLVTSSTQGSFTYPITTIVDTSTRSYHLYASNGYQTTAGGALIAFSIEGPPPSRPPTARPTALLSTAQHVQSVSLTFLDNPGAVGLFEYRVATRGYGVVSSLGDTVRQLTATIIPGHHQVQSTSNSTRQTFSSATEWQSAGVDAAVVVPRSTDIVLLQVNANFETYSTGAVGSYTLFRDDVNLGHPRTGMQTVAAAALHCVRSVSFLWLDTSPGAGSHTYSLRVMSNDTEISFALSGRDQMRQLSAIVMSGAQALSTNRLGSELSLDVGGWMTLDVDVQVEEVSIKDQFLVSLSATLMSSEAFTNTVLTIFRNGVNIGDDTHGLQYVQQPAAEDLLSISMTYLDRPGLSSGPVVYSLRAQVLDGSAVVSLGGQTRTLTVLRLSREIDVPSSAPSAQPSSTPSRQPTSVPSAQPTLEPSNHVVSTCPAGWTSSFGVCYYIDRVDRTHAQCKAFCNAQSASLLCVSKDSENTFLHYNLAPEGFGLWLGSTDATSEGMFVGDSGCYSSYSRWDVANGEPSDTQSAENCAFMLTANSTEHPGWPGYWHDADCAESMGCGCQMPHKNGPLTCPVGYTVGIDGKCIALWPTPITGETCQDLCTSNGAAALCIESLEENEFVYNLAARRSYNVWLGLTRESTGDPWQGCRASFANWALADPNGGLYALMGGTAGGMWSSADSSNGDTLCACQIDRGEMWRPAASAVDSESGALWLNTTTFQPVGTDVHVSTLSADDHVLLTANINVESTRANATAKFTIYRNGVSLADNALQIVKTNYLGEKQAATITFLDAPGTVGRFAYSVQAQSAGASVLSSDQQGRQLAAVTLPFYYPANATSRTDPVYVSEAEWADVGLDLMITTDRLQDKAMITVNLNVALDNHGWAAFTIFRGSVNLADQASPSGGIFQLVKGNRAGKTLQAVTMTYLDTLPATGTDSYSVKAKGAGLPFIVSEQGQTRQLAAVVVRRDEASSTEKNDMYVMSSPLVVSLEVDTTIRTLTAKDRVLVTANVNYNGQSAEAEGAFTLRRDITYLGDSQNGLQTLHTFENGTGKAATITFLDSPGVAGQLVTYSLQGSAISGSVVVSYGNQLRALSAVLISDSFGQPSSQPTAQPSVRPSSYSDTSCLPGWTVYTDKCYLMETTERNWAGCNSFCTAQSARTTSTCVEGAGENYFLASKHPSEDYAWVGLSYDTVLNSLSWSSNKCASSYRNWAGGAMQQVVGQVHHGHNRDQILGPGDIQCARQSTTGTVGAWTLTDCTSTLGCACESPHVLSTTICPVGWTVGLSGECYYFDNAPSPTWEACASTCAAMSATMLCIMDEDENDFIWQLRAGHNTWIGLNRLTGLLVWQAGCASEYYDWAGDEPNTDPYVHIASDQNGRWADTTAASASAVPFRCACQSKSPWKPLRAVTADYEETIHLVDNNGLVSMEMDLAVSTASSRDKVLILASINFDASAFAAGGMAYGGFTLMRGATDLTGGGASFSGVTLYTIGDKLDASIFLLDSPNVVAESIYDVRGLGKGSLSPLGMRRFMTALVIPNYYPLGSTVVTTSIDFTSTAPSWASIDLAVTIATKSITDKVLVLVNLNAYHLLGAATTGSYTVFRDGTNLGNEQTGLLRASGGSPEAQHTLPYCFLDSPGLPGVQGTFTYEAKITNSGPGSFWIGISNEVRTIIAVVLPAESAEQGSAVDTFTLSQSDWESLNISASVTTVSAEDSVLLIVTLTSEMVNGASAAFTIFRDGMNIGNDTYGLKLSRFTGMSAVSISYLDYPSADHSVVTYSVYGRFEGGTVSVSPGGVTRSIIAHLVSSTAGQPTSMPSRQPSSQPSRQPTGQPSGRPTVQPTAQPSRQPTAQPSCRPLANPTSQPSTQPTLQPMAVPTSQPSAQPSRQPSKQPSGQPTGQPSTKPSSQPSNSPTAQPIVDPTSQPSTQPTRQPSTRPSAQPTTQPSKQPSGQPTAQPSRRPTMQPTSAPSNQPSVRPSRQPTLQPSSQPSSQPSAQPSATPSRQPTGQPSARPSTQPSTTPSRQPSVRPSGQPSRSPTAQPSEEPTGKPTVSPTAQPSNAPSVQPSSQPTSQPSKQPSRQPSSLPSTQPISKPSGQPSLRPSAAPSACPSAQPTHGPTGQPSVRPTMLPSVQPSSQPSISPSTQPLSIPSSQPSAIPSGQPTSQPTALPSVFPSAVPTTKPTVQPSTRPTTQPTAVPSSPPTSLPSGMPSVQPSVSPSVQPSTRPSAQPSCIPTVTPSTRPSAPPTALPSDQPSGQPSSEPSSEPTGQPSEQPSAQPSLVPSASPSACPSVQPSMQPSLQPSGRPSKWASAPPSPLPSLRAVNTPSANPTLHPTCQPSVHPTPAPTFRPTAAPSQQPTSQPSGSPTRQPTTQPSRQPSRQPTSQPSSQPSSSPTNSPKKLLLAPNITSIAVSANRTSLDLRVQLEGSQDAFVYCATFAMSSQVPYALRSVSEVTRQNFVAFSVLRAATIRITGLAAAAPYSLFCATQSLDGVLTPLATVQRAVQTANTVCCRRVYVELLISNALEGSARQNAIAVSIDSAPSQTVSLSLAFSSPATTLFPSQVSFQSTSTVSTVTYLTLLAGTEGEVICTGTLSGASAGQYEILYKTRRTLSVLGLARDPPVPALLSGVFSNDGSSVRLTFDSATNRGGFSSGFVCTRLLSFTGSALATCSWADASSILVFPRFSASAASLVVGSQVTLLGGNVKAQCNQANATRCAQFVTLSAQMVSVASATQPTAPVVSMSAPASIGGCNSLLIDLTTSAGSAGRPWASLTFSVSTLPASAEATETLAAFLRTSYVFSPPSVIPNDRLRPGTTYTIQATLCNFLGACGSAVRTVSMTLSQSLVPTANILGASRRTARRMDGLSLNSNSFTQSCTGSISYANLRSTWTIREVSATGALVPVTGLRSTSQNPAVFRLSPYALTVGSLYQITLNATALLSFESATTSVVVEVQSANIVASIVGGTPKSYKQGEPFTVDASRSFDEDVATRTGAAAGLKFEWSCIQSAPSFSAICPLTLTFDSTATNIDRISVASPLAASNTQSRITVRVYDASRSSSAFVDISITQDAKPELSITSSLASLNNVNTNQNLPLLGSLKLVTACTAVWSVDDKSVTLSTASLTPTSAVLQPDSKPLLFNLLVDSGKLPQRASLVFSLTCGDAQTAVTVTTNGAPLPGEFLIAPKNGTELLTPFQFSAVQWSDPDLPIQYQFGFESVTSLSRLVIVSKSEFSYASSTLPAGPEDQQGQLNCSLQVFDSLGASAEKVTTIIVSKATSVQDRQASVLLLISSNTGSVDDTKRVLSVASNVINSVNCTAAPNCTDLHRNKCLTTDQSCGSCAEGYVGDVGDQNSPCMPFAAASSNRTVEVKCEGDSSCKSWEYCEARTGRCEVQPKSCFRNCSDHGTCIYTSTSLGIYVPQSECKIDNHFCIATCSCFDQYSGRLCEISNTDLRSRRAVRSQLISSLQNLTLIDDINVNSMISWSANLYSLSLNPYELSVNDAANIVAIANATLQNAIALGVESIDQMRGILQATDTVSSVRRYNYNPNDYNSENFDTSYEFVNNTAVGIIPVLSLYSSLVQDTMVLGQKEISYQYENFRMSAGLHTLASNGDNITVTAPVSDYENFVGASASSIAFIPRLAGDRNSSTGTVSVNLISVYPRSYAADTSSFDSDPIYLQLGSDSKEHPAEYLSSLEITFQRNLLLARDYSADVVNVTSQCFGNSTSEMYTHVCPGSRQVVVHNCAGRRGTLSTSCPKYAPVCAQLNVVSAEFDVLTSCAVQSSNVSAIVCSCTLGSPDRRRALAEPALGNTHSTQPGSGQRRLNTETDAVDDSGVMNMVATSVYVATSFGDTFNAADDFTTAGDLSQVMTVIYLISTIWGTGFLLLFVCTVKSHPAVRTAIKRKLSSGKISMDASKTEETLQDVKKRFLEYVESVVPKVYASDKSQLSRMTAELCAHHRYMTLFTLGDEKISTFSKIVILLKVVTVDTMQMFLLAVLYDLQSPDDDGTCVNYTSASTCLSRKSALDSEEEYCKWEYSAAQEQFACSYQQPRSNPKMFIYILVFISVVTSIINIPIDALFAICVAPLLSDAEAAVASKTSAFRRLTVAAATATRNARRLSEAATQAASQAAATVRRQSASALAYIAPKQRFTFLEYLAAREPRTTVIANREIPDDLRRAHSEVVAMLPRMALQAQLRERSRNDTTELVKSFALHKRSRRFESSPVAKRGHIEIADTQVRSAENTMEQDEENPVLTSALNSLCEEVIGQRLLLLNGSEGAALFDAQWGIECVDAGDDKTGPVYAVSQRARMAIREAILESEEAAAELRNKLPDYTVHHAGLAVLHLFLQDILGRNTVAAKIFENKFEEDFSQTRPVGYVQKALALICIMGGNAFFIYFTLLRAFVQGKTWQRSFVLACVAQMVVEILLNETFECLWLNYLVPALVRKEVKKAILLLRSVAEELTGDIDGKQLLKNRIFLDAPTYLFSATKVAQANQGLLESVVVLAYHTHLPGELAKTWPHYQETLEREDRELQQRGAGMGRYAQYRLTALRLIFATSATVVLTLQWMGTFQFAYQRVIIRFIQPLLFTGLTLLCFFSASSFAALVAVILVGITIVAALAWQQRVIALREAADAKVVVVSDATDASVEHELLRYQYMEYNTGSSSSSSSSSGHPADPADAAGGVSPAAQPTVPAQAIAASVSRSASSSSASMSIENAPIALRKPASSTSQSSWEAKPASSLSDYGVGKLSSLSGDGQYRDMRASSLEEEAATASSSTGLSAIKSWQGSAAAMSEHSSWESLPGGDGLTHAARRYYSGDHGDEGEEDFEDKSVAASEEEGTGVGGDPEWGGDEGNEADEYADEGPEGEGDEGSFTFFSSEDGSGDEGGDEF